MEADSLPVSQPLKSFNMPKVALITGINGQDGSYLAEFLLEQKAYEVHGLVRRSATGNLKNIQHLLESITIHHGDLADSSSLYRIIEEVRPNEFYNLAAQADVQESYLMPEYSVDVNGISVIKMLEAIRRIDPKIKFYQASTSELFGDTKECPQNEETRMNPNSPYALGKFIAYQAVKNYREQYGLFACNGILNNHESERRGEDYVTRKITKAVARIKAGLQKDLRLGNLEPKRDWGYAKEYVQAMWLMLQYPTPEDFVIGTGETHSVKEWMEECFKYVGLDWKDYVIEDPTLFRPSELYLLQADYSKAKSLLNWQPEIKFHELIGIMMEADIKLANQEKNANL